MGDEVQGGGGQAGAAAAAAQPTPAAAPQAAPAAEPMRTLKYKGKEVSIPESRVTDYAQMGYDYQQKLQAHAADRQAWEQREAEYRQAFAEVQGFLADRQRIRAYLQELEGQGGPAAAAPAADQLDTTGITSQQVEQMIQQRLASERQQYQQQLTSVQQQMEVKAMAAQYTQDLDAHISGLMTEYPELKAIRNVGEILKLEASKTRPKDIGEARDAIATLAKEYAVTMREHVANTQKQGVGGGGGVVPPRGIEPPGGSGPMPQAAPAYKGKITDPAFKELVMRDLAAAMQER